ncbi:MAG: DUF4861 family protein [Verrucomicrobiia bacterium]|jgi:hypothetical protein
MTKIGKLLTTLLLAALPRLCLAADGQLTVKTANKLQVARLHQTIELSASQLAPLGEKDLNKIHVKDDGGKEVLCQAVDTDFDAYHTPDIVIFQSDFGPGETKTFTVSTGAKQVYTKDQFKAYGRFVRERFDDFAWENDRIAHRMYGKALETWAGEPLTSSSVDVWSKRVPYMVIDGWYMAADYHVDHGEGLDDYSAGATRGCGGNGLWAADKLWVSRNFVNSRVLADGPIRVVFELDYEPFDVNGAKVAEVKRITLDAGGNLDHFQSFYKPQGDSKSLVCGIGIKKVADAKKDFNAERGSLCIWEPMEKNQGMQGIALIVDPKALQKEAEDRQNNLLLVKAGADNSVSYWAGFFWNKSGQFPGYDAWKSYVDQFSQGLASPIEVSVSVK